MMHDEVFMISASDAEPNLNSLRLRHTLCITDDLQGIHFKNGVNYAFYTRKTASLVEA